MEDRQVQHRHLKQLREAVRRVPLLAGAAHRWDRRRERLLAAQRTVGPHECTWKLAGFASLPIDEDSASVSTLVIEECRLCPAMRSEVLGGRWIPNQLGQLVRMGDGVATALAPTADV